MQAALLSEAILARQGIILSQKFLDTVARESGAEDFDGDGIIGYKDLITTKRSYANNITKITP